MCGTLVWYVDDLMLVSRCCCYGVGMLLLVCNWYGTLGGYSDDMMLVSSLITWYAVAMVLVCCWYAGLMLLVCSWYATLCYWFLVAPKDMYLLIHIRLHT